MYICIYVYMYMGNTAFAMQDRTLNAACRLKQPRGSIYGCREVGHVKPFHCDRLIGIMIQRVATRVLYVGFQFIIVRSSDRKATRGSAILPLQPNHHVRQYMYSMIETSPVCAFGVLDLPLCVRTGNVCSNIMNAHTHSMFESHAYM